ncbi:hypothetical protein QBC43DRAFT_349343 [Cladorrhinum sp. PSN259]|nr:hypothetical protein QBC43DRAFT_349343 [Cladorrhinum sp. PSN259]
MSSTAGSSGRPTNPSSAKPLAPRRDSWVLVQGTEKYSVNIPKRLSDKKYNHVICIDGTSNNQLNDVKAKNIGQLTNVGRISHLFPATTKDGRIQQVLYQPGIGSVSDWGTKWTRFFDNVLDQGLGGDFAKMVVSLYRYISLVYQPGDQILMLGFSRGAYVARVLSSFIADVGACIFHLKRPTASQDECETVFLEIFSQWRQRKGGPASKEHTNFMQPTKVDFLGLFDTVAALGLPDIAEWNFSCTNYRFAEEIDKRPLIKRAYQAIALDEHRENFKCVLFTKRNEKQDIQQVWFRGFHESVGGGNGDPGITVPYLTLIWMVSKFRGLVDINENAFKAYVAPSNGHTPCGDVPDSRSGVWRGNTNEYRGTKVGSGVNEKRHCTSEQPGFTLFTGIPQMPDADPTNKSRLAKVAKEMPNPWEQEMLKLLATNVDGVRGYVDDTLHNLKHHDLHGIFHSPYFTDNAFPEGTPGNSSGAAVSVRVQRVQTQTTTQTTVQVKKAAPLANKTAPQQGVAPARRVQTGLQQAPAVKDKQPQRMPRAQTLPVRGGTSTTVSSQASTQKTVVGGGKVVSSSSKTVVKSTTVSTAQK